jgi:hypothetical protein
MSITAMIAYIWYIIRDYSVSTYSLKQVCSVAAEELQKKGHSVTIGSRGRLTVDGNTYLVYKLHGWNRYDVRHTV